jgi:hypothetical protein
MEVQIHTWEGSGAATQHIYAWIGQRKDAADHVLCDSDDYPKALYSTLERPPAQWQAAAKRPGFVLLVKLPRLPTLPDHIRRSELSASSHLLRGEHSQPRRIAPERILHSAGQSGEEAQGGDWLERRGWDDRAGDVIEVSYSRSSLLTKRGKLTKLEFLRSAGVAIARRRGSERRTRKCACHTRRERSKIVVEIDYGSFTPAGELPNRGFGRRPSPEMVDHLSSAETE